MAASKKRVVKKKAEAKRFPVIEAMKAAGVVFTVSKPEKSEVERLADELERVVIEMQLRGDQREQLLGFVERLRAVG
jgi:hypothetical protein